MSGISSHPAIAASTTDRRRLSRASERDRGSATLEIAILGPAILLLTFTIIQAGLWFYGRSLALAAAQEGVTAARAYQAPSGAGTARARTFLAEQAGDSLRGTTVSESGSAGSVRVDVTGQVLSVLPGLTGFTVSQSAQAPRERFTTAVTP